MNEHAQARRGRSEAIEITLKGDPSVVARLLAVMAGQLDPSPEVIDALREVQPQPLYLTRSQAVARLGRGGADQLRALLQAGKVRNHGTVKGIKIDPKELERAIGG